MLFIIKLLLRKIAILLLVLVASRLSADAWTHGGPVFDSSWTCFRTQVSGACPFTASQYFNATCDGSTSDDAARIAMITYGAARNPAVLKVHWGNGSRCTLAGGLTFINYDGAEIGGTALQNLQIWAYGGSVDTITFGGEAIFHDAVHQATISTVSANSSTINVNDGNISRFANGDPILITGDCLDSAAGGYPPNTQFHETNRIANIAGTVITLATPTLYQYKSTWPICTPGAGVGNLGPATIFKLHPSWDSTIDVSGLTITNPLAAQINILNKQTTLTDVTETTQTIAPSVVQNFVANRGAFGGVEVDKLADKMTFNGTTLSGNVFVQSASPNNLILNNVIFNCGAVVGNAVNGIFTNITFGSGCGGGTIGVGVAFYGHGNSATVSGGAFATAAMFTTEFPTADITSFSSGTFVVSKSAGGPIISGFFQTFVPTFEYKMSAHNQFEFACSPLTTFWVTDIREDASNYYADTGTWVQAGSAIATPATLPVVTCGATPTITPYPAQTITQTGTGASPSLTIYAPPQ